MRAICLSDSDPSSPLVEEDLPEPQAGPDELLIRVYAAGLTPTELAWYPTTHLKTGAPRSRAVPGHEFSGVIAGMGEHISGFQLGQEVYGMNDWFAEGALAEYCLTQPACIAPKPASLTHVEAASVPIGALTAWQGLFDRAGLQAGERVLVHGASGSVGAFAVQFGYMHSAHVIATASERNLGFVSQLGAEQVIDYRSQRFEDQIGDIDVVFDTVGGETFERSWQVLKPGGRMVTIAANAEGSADERIKQAFFIVEPNRDQLARVADLIDAGSLRTTVDAVVPLSESPLAFAGKVTQREGRGKMVVAVAQAAQERYAHY